MNKVFERNINALKDADLKEKLLNYEYKSKPVLAATNGYNIQYNGQYLHSEENPLAESQAILNQSKNILKNIHIVYGLGLGYLFQLTVRDAKDAVLLYEPNFDILHNSFTLVDFSSELSKNNVYLFTDFEKLLDFVSNNTKQNTTVDILSLPSYREMYKDVFQEQTKKIELTFGSVLLDYSYKRKRMYTSTLMTIYNIPELLKEIPVNIFENVYSGQTAIIVSAGPTLSENIEALKKYQGKAAIFTVGPALKTLVKNGIKTDYLCIIESYDCSKQVEGVDLSEITLISEPYTNKNIHALKCKEKLLHVSSNMPMSQYFADVTGLSTEGYLAQGTVSFMAFNTAVKMGFSKIILVGQDLAYIDGQCYAKDSAYDGLVCKLNTKTNKYEIVAEDIKKYADSLLANGDETKKIASAKRRLAYLNSVLYSVPGIEGKPVPTEAGYASFIKHISDYARSLDNVELINTSMKGAQIDGFKNMSIEDAMKNAKKSKKIKLKSDFSFDKKSVKDKLTNTLNSLKKSMEICDECGKSVSRLSMDYKRNKAVDKDKLLRIRKLIEQYTILNDFNNKDNVIFRYITAAEEMKLNDILTMVKAYNEKTTPKVIQELKDYYDSIQPKVKYTASSLSNAINEIEV